MDHIKIEFDIPKDIVIQLNYTIDELKTDIINNIAMELYNKGKISLSKAAQLANICKKDFIKLLSKNNFSLFNWDEDELNEEFFAVKKIEKKIK